jgi:hypothetical protein
MLTIKNVRVRCLLVDRVLYILDSFRVTAVSLFNPSIGLMRGFRRVWLPLAFKIEVDFGIVMSESECGIYS